MNNLSDNEITLFARTNYRGQNWPLNKVFGIRRKDRRSHIFVIGKTGTGKSHLLKTLILSDLNSPTLNRQGFALVDPHGDLVESVLAKIPEHRKKDVIYFNVPDTAHPLAFNPLENVPPERRPLACSQLLEAFQKIWDDSWGPRVEHVLRNSFLALLDQPEATLKDVLRLLDHKSFRERAMRNVSNEEVRRFWLKEYKGYTFGIRAMVKLPIQNKVGAFVSNPLLQPILGQPRSSFDLRQIMDTGKILLVNLAKGRIGQDVAFLLGALLTTKIGLAALGRADVPEEERRDFFLYADEASSYTSLAFANALAELRKYRLGIVAAGQTLSQMDGEVRDAILGNAGTIIVFRVGPVDAGFLAKEFDPVFSPTDLLSLPNYTVYLRLLIDGKPSKPFSAETLPLAPTTQTSNLTLSAHETCK